MIFYLTLSNISTSPQISAVVVSLNEGLNLRATVEHLRATLPEGSEIVVVDDGSTDGSAGFLASIEGRIQLIRSRCVGSAKARNLGARQSNGEIIVFADAHITVQPGWWIPLVDLLANPCVGGVAPVISDMEASHCKGYGMSLPGPDLTAKWLGRQGNAPYQTPILPGACWAMRRDTFEATGGFDEGIIRWGSEDVELSLRLWLLGYQLWLAPQVEARHLFRETRPYDVEWSWVVHNKLRFAFLHFATGRITRVVEALREQEGFAAALALMAESDAATRRAELASCRLHDDEWFFQKFGLNW